MVCADGQRNADGMIGKLWPGCAMTGLTKGQFSQINIIRTVLDSTGPAHLIVSTWTMSPGDAERLSLLAADGRLLSVVVLADRSFPRCKPEYCAYVQQLFGAASVRATKTHSKFALIWNDAWSVVVRGSMNLNANPRFEQFDLDDSPELLAFFREHVEAQPVGFDAPMVEHEFAKPLGEPTTAAERRGIKAKKDRDKDLALAVTAKNAAHFPAGG
tara:strand:+ start:155 stop:799 length:645 start_codon:yes stop_codon:yes gene_type:complete